MFWTYSVVVFLNDYYILLLWVGIIKHFLHTRFCRPVLFSVRWMKQFSVSLRERMYQTTRIWVVNPTSTHRIRAMANGCWTTLARRLLCHAPMQMVSGNGWLNATPKGSGWWVTVFAPTKSNLWKLPGLIGHIPLQQVVIYYTMSQFAFIFIIIHDHSTVPNCSASVR